MASGVVRAAIAKLFDEECSFSYTERGGKVVDLSRKLLENVDDVTREFPIPLPPLICLWLPILIVRYA